MSHSRVMRLGWVLCTVILMIILYYASEHLGRTPTPQPQLIALNKLVLAMLAGIAGYLLDIVLFPYSRPDGYLRDECPGMRPGTLLTGSPEYPVDGEYQGLFAVAMLRRAVIVGTVIIGVCLGL